MRNKILAIGLVLSLAVVGIFATADICTNPKLGNCQAGGFGVESAAAVSGVDPRWDNMIVGYNMGEASGVALDILEGNDLADNNTVGTRTGKIGEARDFISTNNEYLTSESAILLPSTWTWSAWIYADSWPAGFPAVCNVINTWNTLLAFSGHYATTTGNWTPVVGAHDPSSTSQVSASESISTGAWHFIVVWYNDDTDRKVHTSIDDGTVYNAGFANTGIVDTTARTLWVGDAPNTLANFDGAIDELYFYSEIKDSAWITAMHNGGAGRAYPD